MTIFDGGVGGTGSDPAAADAPAAQPAGSDVTGSVGPTTLASRYELLGLLGSGGMGTVYRARDRELEEIVALKVLRRELAHAGGMLERFRREVKLARKVTHKNVARTFDIGEHGGDRFLTMEYIDGEPLSTLLARSGRLPVDRVVAIARDVLDGLAASHEAGVVHGDLKPENVICAQTGRVVITDFGIARALISDPSQPHTMTGAVVGTPAYMAPEQVEGAVDLDGRADIYALGCMMFRLLTGDAPWSGTSFVSTAAARLLRDPPDPRERVPDLPEPVRDVILRCMAKRREDRFSTAREASAALVEAVGSLTRNSALPPLSTGLRDLPPMPSVPRAASVSASHVGPSGGTRSIAVLPVVNGSAPEDAYLASGLTDDLIDVLSAVPRLRVRPRGAVLAYAASDRDARDAGRTLGVDAVVDGSVRRNGDLLRITLRLVTVEDGFQLWARRFDRAPSEFLSIADEAASELASVLASEKVAAPREHPTDAIALDLYLRGRFLYARSFFDVAQAVALLRTAHERAPRDARISGTYAVALMRQYMVEVLPATVVQQARAIAEEAIARDPTAPEAHVALALTHLNEGEGRSAATALVRALAASPTNADALHWTGNLLLEVGNLEDALRNLLLARGSDSNVSVIENGLARGYALLGDWEAADATLPAAGSSRNDPLLQWVTRARLAVWRRDAERAAALIEEVASVPLAEAARIRLLGMLLVARDRRVAPETLRLLDNELRSVSVPRRAAFNAQLRMELLTTAGEIEEAKASYEQLTASSFVDINWLDRCPAIAELRDTPEHAAVRRTTLPRAERIAEVFEARRTR